MYPSCYFKISSSLMCLLFMVTFGFANGEIIKRMNTPLSLNYTPENRSIGHEKDTVSSLDRRALSPIPSLEIKNRKVETYTKSLYFSIIHEIPLTSIENSPISESPQKNANFDAQMRGGKRGARGYREMKGYGELDLDNQFFEDSEVVANERDMQVFPNPAKDWIAIYLPETINVKQILLHDMTGVVVNNWISGNNFKETGLIKISTEHISPGTYTLRIVGNSIVLKPIRILIKK